MIIDGHPDILRGPQGLNGLHGFGSAAYDRFSASGGAGVDALYKEIRDYVSNHSQAEIQAQAERSGVSQTDIIQAFAQIDAALPPGQSPAVKRYLPENGGAGLPALYQEILDYQRTHSLAELMAQQVRSGVSRADVNAANAYDFAQSQAGGGAGVPGTQAEQAAAAQAAQAIGAAQAAREAQSAAASVAVQRAREADDAARIALAARTAAAAAQAAEAEKVAKAAQAALEAKAAETARKDAAAAAAAAAAAGTKIVDCLPGYAWDGEMCRATGLQEPTGASVGVNLPLVISAMAAYFLVG